MGHGLPLQVLQAQLCPLFSFQEPHTAAKPKEDAAWGWRAPVTRPEVPLWALLSVP